MSSIFSNRLKTTDDPGNVPLSAAPGDSDEELNSEQPNVPPGISDEEATALRAEKLKAIREAIDAEAYDSDELLHKALQKMQDSLLDEES